MTGGETGPIFTCCGGPLCPPPLVEVGFVTGAADAPRLADPAWREVLANAIARGILQYIAQTN